MVKELPLSNGMVALVDDDVYEWASKFNWHARRAKPGAAYYVVRNIREPKNASGVGMERLHRAIMKAPRGVDVDHIDRNTMDCRVANLRFATRSQNNMNRKKNSKHASKFKGVAWHGLRCKWVAQIQFNGEHYYLGLFTDEKDAARAYDMKAREFFGDFVRPNFPQEGERGVNA